MTDKSAKLLAKLSDKQQQAILIVLGRLLMGNTHGLNIKPLRGHKDLFRARVGQYRIIYRQQNGAISFVGLNKRDDQTYRDL
ncbi:MAG TPA: hypothetical protein VF401_01465 [Candidatus Saccharimonadales bacterium]